MLRAIADRAEPVSAMSVADVVRSTGIGLSTVSRIAAELSGDGVLERAGKVGAYRIGSRLVRLAGRSAHGYLNDLQLALAYANRATSETVCLVEATPGGCDWGHVRVVAAVPASWTLHVAARQGELLDDESGTVTAALTAPLGARAEVRRVFRVDSGDRDVVDSAVPVCDRYGRTFGALLVRAPRFRAGNRVRLDNALISARQRLEAALARADLGESSSSSQPGHLSETPTLELVIRLLEIIAHSDGHSIEKLAHAVGCAVDRVARIVSSSQAVGIVRAGDLDAGPALSAGMAGWYLNSLPQLLLAAGREPLREVRDGFGISTYLTRLQGIKSVTLLEFVAAGALQTASWVGKSFPFAGSDGAPSLVAAFDDTEIRALFEVDVRRPGRGIPRTAGDFLVPVQTVRREGAVVIKEFGENGLASVTSPVFGLAGDVAAAVCLVGPLGDVERRETALRREAIRVAESMTRALRQP